MAVETVSSKKIEILKNYQETLRCKINSCVMLLDQLNTTHNDILNFCEGIDGGANQIPSRIFVMRNDVNDLIEQLLVELVKSIRLTEKEENLQIRLKVLEEMKAEKEAALKLRFDASQFLYTIQKEEKLSSLSNEDIVEFIFENDWTAIDVVMEQLYASKLDLSQEIEEINFQINKIVKNN